MPNPFPNLGDLWQFKSSNGHRETFIVTRKFFRDGEVCYMLSVQNDTIISVSTETLRFSTTIWSPLTNF